MRRRFSVRESRSFELDIPSASGALCLVWRMECVITFFRFLSPLKGFGYMKKKKYFILLNFVETVHDKKQNHLFFRCFYKHTYRYFMDFKIDKTKMVLCA